MRDQRTSRVLVFVQTRLQQVYASGTPLPEPANQNPTLARIVNMLTDGSLSALQLLNSRYPLINNDPDLVLIDFEAYVKRAGIAYSVLCRPSLNARVLITQQTLVSSADRTIREAAEDIWHVICV